VSAAPAHGGAEEVLLSIEAGVATITRNRPQRLNALNDGLVETLAKHLGACREETPGVFVGRGAGRPFASGHHLPDAGAPSGPAPVGEARRGAEALQELTRRIRALPCPVLAAVHGYAIGGGAELALSADLVIVASDAIFQFTETAVGLTITNGSSRTLPLTVGPFLARELVMMGERFDGERAARLGLANRAVAPERLEAETAAVVESLRAKAPLALAAAKRLLDAGPGGDLERAMAAEVAEAAPLELSADAEEAAHAFVEKRDPAFKGR
jgi:enoyl-CoA hydratase/carnithine racemase